MRWQGGRARQAQPWAGSRAAPHAVAAAAALTWPARRVVVSRPLPCPLALPRRGYNPTSEGRMAGTDAFFAYTASEGNVLTVQYNLPGGCGAAAQPASLVLGRVRCGGRRPADALPPPCQLPCPPTTPRQHRRRLLAAPLPSPARRLLPGGRTRESAVHRCRLWQAERRLLGGLLAGVAQPAHQDHHQLRM